ncbi:MAG: WG repeat-containing protein [Pirellulales bacterium]
MAAVRTAKYFGFIDHLGTTVVTPQFSFAGEFHEGLARVEIPNTAFGYINRKGNLVIPAIYYEARDFSEGLAETATRDRRFYIRADGRVAFEVRGGEKGRGEILTTRSAK